VAAHRGHVFIIAYFQQRILIGGKIEARRDWFVNTLAVDETERQTKERNKDKRMNFMGW